MGVWLLTALLAMTAPPWATGESRGEDLQVHVVTFGPGDDIAEWFGHAAIVIEDTARREARLYNYGEYAFDPTLALRYLQGHLTFQVGERPFQRTLQLYAQKNRDVRLQTLALSTTQKLKLAALLADNVKPENRQYLYDHYSDNCTTRIRDALDTVTDGALRRQAGPGLMTLREHTSSLSAVSPVLSVLIDMLLNDDVDRPISTWEETFLPREFERFLDGVVLTDEVGRVRPLVAARRIVHAARRPPPPPPPSVALLLALGVGAGVAIIVATALAGRHRRRVFGVIVAIAGLVFGLPGLVLTLMATVTDHHVTFWNENLLVLHPLALLLPPAGVLLMVSSSSSTSPWSTRAGRVVVAVLTVMAVGAVVAVVGKVVPAFDQRNGAVLAVVVPVWLSLWLCRRVVNP
jgi:putative effector of murein hydrolase LrgA (UPF0299 family)